MISKVLNTLPADMVETRNLFQNWRATRKPGSAIPDELWNAAMDVARTHGVYLTSRTLPIDYGALKKRLETGGAESRPAFVELAPMISTPPTPLDGSVVEFVETDGSRMTVRLPAGAALDLAGLVSAFRRRAS
jgi:hypothetical protein